MRSTPRPRRWPSLGRGAPVDNLQVHRRRSGVYHPGRSGGSASARRMRWPSSARSTRA
jgi:hypothetical protein